MLLFSVSGRMLGRTQCKTNAIIKCDLAAIRVSLSWFSTRKSLTAEQKTEAAATFRAKARFLQSLSGGLWDRLTLLLIRSAAKSARRDSGPVGLRPEAVTLGLALPPLPFFL